MSLMSFNKTRMKDDSKLHGEDEQENTDDDSTDMTADDDGTLEDTDDESDDSKKETGEEVKERQKKAWLSKIRDGKKTLDDMPKNLEWLKKEVKKELDTTEDEADEDKLSSKIRQTLQKEREAEDFVSLVDYLEESVDDEDILSDVQTAYEEMRQEGVSKFKAIKYAMKAAGIKDTQTVITERRRKGMLLPPNGNKNRKVVSKDGMTEMERKFNKDLPNGFKL